MLTVGLSAHAGETVAFHNALETFTFRYAGHVDPVVFLEHVYGKRVAQVDFAFDAGEFGQFALGGGVGLFEVAEQAAGRVFFGFFVIGKLNGAVAVLFNGSHLRNHTGTSFDNGAGDVFPVGTEYGSHSDFLSN